MKVYTLEQVIFDGDQIDDYAISEIVKLSINPISEEEAINLMQNKLIENGEEDDVEIKKTDKEFCNGIYRYIPDFMLYYKKRDDERYRFSYFLNRVYEVEE